MVTARRVTREFHPATKLMLLVTFTLVVLVQPARVTSVVCAGLLVLILVLARRGYRLTRSLVVAMQVGVFVMVTAFPRSFSEALVAAQFAQGLIALVLGSSLFGLWFRSGDALLLARFISGDPRVARCAVVMIKAVPTFTDAVRDVLDASRARGFRLSISTVVSFHIFRALAVPVMVRLTRDILLVWLDAVMRSADMTRVPRASFRHADVLLLAGAMAWVIVVISR